jgi:hypothetical protein
VGIPTNCVMTKSPLCQEKSASRSPFTVNDFGFEKENNIKKEKVPGK